jgi:hypothetical protein
MIRSLLAAVVVLVLSGCASNVITDYDSGAAFSSYSSWDFAPSKEGEQSFVSLDGSRIQSAIEREMGGENLQKVATDEADLLVAWQIVAEERLERGGSGLGFGLGFGTGNFGWGLSTAPPIEKIEEGKLVIELVDSETRQVVWRSASRRYLNERQTSESRQELIDEIVTDMFEEYPPGVK